MNIWIAAELQGVETVTTIRRKFPCILPVGSALHIDTGADLYRMEICGIDWWDSDKEVILNLGWEDPDTVPCQSSLPEWIGAGWEEW